MSLTDMVINQLKSSIEKKLKSLDVNHDGHPDLPELMQHFEDAAKAIEPLISKIQPSDVNIVIESLNHMLGDKLNPSEVSLVEQGIASASTGLVLFEKMCEELGAQAK